MFRYCLATIRNKDISEELVQDTFRIACSQIGEVMNSQNPQGWMMNTLKYVMLSYLRGRAKYAALISRYTAEREQRGSSYTTEIDIDVLYGDLLDSADYKLLKRYYLEDKSLKLIADADDITLEACKKRLQRARKRLKEYFQTG